MAAGEEIESVGIDGNGSDGVVVRHHRMDQHTATHIFVYFALFLLSGILAQVKSLVRII